MAEIFSNYFKWHYGKSFTELFGVIKNFISFILHFFSFKLLLKTLFHPWRRMKENYPKMDLGAFFSSLLVNIIMRIVGLISRLIIISIGLLSLFFTITFSIFLFLVWFFLPFLIVGCIVAGLSIMIQTI